MNEKILVVNGLTKTFTQAGRKITVIENLNFDIAIGSVSVITGKSGSGKSTLLHLLGGLDKPDSGSVNIDGADIIKFSDSELNQFRSRYVGFVFQFHHLLLDFTAFENIVIPLMIAGCYTPEKREYAEYLMNKLGIYERAGHYPTQMSGGEQQRAAIARAIINNPKLLLADEPTGNLDNETAVEVIDLFGKINAEFQTTIIIVTHDKNIPLKSDNLFELKNTQIFASDNFNNKTAN